MARGKNNRISRRTVLAVLSIVGVVGIWLVMTWVTRVIPPAFLPPPQNIVTDFFRILGNPYVGNTLVGHTLVSLQIQVSVSPSLLRLDDLDYRADGAEAHFISFTTPDLKLAGFIRISLPLEDSPGTGLTDLGGAALIREVHVYGQSLPVGSESQGAAQHTGIGTRLLAEPNALRMGGDIKRWR